MKADVYTTISFTQNEERREGRRKARRTNQITLHKGLKAVGGKGRLIKLPKLPL